MKLDTGVQLKNCKGRVNSQTINVIGPHHTLDIRQEIPYSRKLLREKTFQIGKKKYDFRGENFHGLFAFATPKDTTPQNFVEKTFMNSHKTEKFMILPRKFPAITWYTNSLQ